VATPLDAVQEQFTKGETNRITDIIGKIGLELLKEALDAVHRLPRARHEQLDPLWSCRQHLDPRNVSRCR
jgi:hypothetical protein